MLRSFIIIICFVAMGCAATSGPEREKRSVLHSKNGTALLQNGKIPEAIGELKKATDLDPDNAVAQNNLALAYLFRRRPDLSEGHLRKAVALDSNYTEARNNLGRVLIELEKYDEAIKHLMIASRDLTFSAPQKTYSNLGLAYFKSGQFDKAKTSIEKSLSFEKQRCASLNLYGKVLYKLANFNAASASFDQAIRNCRTKPFAEPHYFSGLSYLKTGNTDLAKARFEEVVKLFPESSFGSKAKRALKSIAQGKTF